MAMAASAIGGGVRFVRCPKCHKLLTEFAQVPIYRCGGCTTLLTVKVQSLENASTNLAESSTSSATKSAPSSSSSSEVAKSDRHRTSNSNVARNNPNGKTEEPSYCVDKQQEAAHDTRSFRHKKASSTDNITTTELHGRDTTHWMDSEVDHDDPLLFRGNSESSSYSEPDRVKILRKVDELRDELSEFLTRTNFPIRNDESGRGRRHGRIRAKKQPAVKQYYRPVCGGAPFVVCYKCLKLLQLPADFLVSRSETLHRLRCGGCSETLVFSFRRPRAPRTPPADEAQLRSRSECYSSSEPEPVHNVSRNSSSSYSTLITGSRLHQLMGYSSASDVLLRSGHAGVGYESSETSTPGPRVDRPEQIWSRN